MRDIYRSARTHPYKCVYWKRYINGVMDNEELVIKRQPSGMFYAKISSSHFNDTIDVAGAVRYGVESVTIETNDIVKLDKDDLVQYRRKIWHVDGVNDDPIQKNAFYSGTESKTTYIKLTKGANDD